MASPSSQACAGRSRKHRVDVFRGLVKAVDREQLGLDLLAKDPRGGVAVDAGHRAAAQRAVDVDRAAGDDLRAGADRAEHGDVAVGNTIDWPERTGLSSSSEVGSAWRGLRLFRFDRTSTARARRSAAAACPARAAPRRRPRCRARGCCALRGW